jgi:hypothetical protein
MYYLSSVLAASSEISILAFAKAAQIKEIVYILHTAFWDGKSYYAVD